MKIWLDLRFISDNTYSTFVIQLVQELVQKNPNNNYLIYTNKNLELFNFQNVIIKNVGIKTFSIKEQINYLKILKKDKNNIMLFFNHYKPIFYTWVSFILLPSLKDVYYNNFSNYFKKYGFLYLLEKNLKKANKIICFDSNTNWELIEKFNINEKQITYLKWFFPNTNLSNNLAEVKINIKAKYDIKNNYFIYSGWEWVEKNYEKLIYIFERFKKENIKVDLIIMWDQISKNISLRHLILELKMQNNIHFISVIKQSEKQFFYKNALWVIFPSFYEPFPFKLNEALYFNTPIISSDLKNIKDIFWESIQYFSPISVNSIYSSIKEFIEKEDSITDYSDIKNKYKLSETVEELIEIMK